MIIGVGIDVVDVARFMATVERVPGLRARLFTPANRFQLLIDGPQFFPRILASIEAAERRVDIELGTVQEIALRNNADKRPVVVDHRQAALIGLNQ